MFLLGEELREGRLAINLFHKRTARYLNDHTELLSIAYLDANNVTRWVLPVDFRYLVGTVDIWIGRSRRDERSDRHVWLGPPLSSVKGQKVFNLYLHVQEGEEHLGTFVAQFLWNELLRVSTKDATREKYFGVLRYRQNTVLASFGDSGDGDLDYQSAKSVTIFGQNYSLEFIRRTRKQSLWHSTVYILGFILSGALAWSFWMLGQDNRRRRAIQRELQKAKDAAEAANRAKSELIANISHELRTPLGIIHGFTELLLRLSESEEQRAARIRTIRSNAEDLLDLINDLLDLSKIEVGLLNTESRNFDWRGEIEQVVTLFRQQVETKGLHLITRYASELPKTLCSDRQRFRQILINLVGNAVKFTEEGQIVIEAGTVASGAEAYLRIQIHDTGIGISHDHQQKVFSRFSQADGSISRKYGGTGLGLTLSKRLSELMGGDIHLVSSQPDVGSTFAFDLPLHLASQTTESDQDLPLLEEQALLLSEPIATELFGIKVLVVDDCQDNLNLYSSLLQAVGAQAYCARGYEEARTFVHDQSVDIIFMDIQMPSIDGYEATRRLRHANVQVPIVALTAHAMRGERERCLQAGCNDVLVKPTDAAKLVACVQHWLPEIREWTVQNPWPVLSEYRDDPRVAPLLPQFIAGLPQRLRDLRQDLTNLEFVALGRRAHSLKGTAANYGFPALALAAQHLEKCALDRQDQKLLTLRIEELEELMHQVTRGLKV